MTSVPIVITCIKFLGINNAGTMIGTIRLLARWESRSPMDGHFSEKINMNDCIQRVFYQIWKSLDTFALITAEKHLACSSDPPWGQSQAL